MKLPPDVLAKVLAGAEPSARPREADPYAEVPLPPSANNLFVTRGSRRFKSPEYRAWLALVAPRLCRLKPPASFPVALEATVVGAINAARDLDNLLKPLGDALVAAEVLPGDSVTHVRKWSVEWKPGAGQEPVVLIRIVGGV